MDDKEINSLIEQSMAVDDKASREVSSGERRIAIIKLLINCAIFIIAFIIGKIIIKSGNNNGGQAVIVMFVAIIIISFISFWDSGNKIWNYLNSILLDLVF